MDDKDTCEHIERALAAFKAEGLRFDYADAYTTSIIVCRACDARRDTWEPRAV